MSSEHDTSRVSETYREIAKETSPAALDDRILKMATQEARTRYGLARAWVRPVAWAATIGLSFAFILEMTYFGDDAPPVEAVIPAGADRNVDEAVKPASQAPAFKSAPPATVIAAPEIKASEQPALREAEERDDAAVSGYAQRARTAATRAELASFDVATSDSRCDAEARQSAETWYRCVLALREQGFEAAAAEELRELQETFPEFREPVPE